MFVTSKNSLKNPVFSHAFGMEMPTRSFSSGYRYGFNGKENIEELNGWQDYGERMYNRLTARFPSPDPITTSYPELSPYQFASNTPIRAIDLDGLELFFVNGWDGISAITKEEQKSQDLAKMKKYWTNNNPNFISEIQSFFQYKSQDVHFIDGSQGGASHGSVKERRELGRKMAMELISSQQIDFSRPITLIGHSQGGAFVSGMEEYIYAYATKNSLNVKVNTILLTPDGAEQFSIKKESKSLQLTYGDDGVVTNNKATVGNVDIDANPTRSEYSPFQTSSLSKSLKAHSAPIDEPRNLLMILKNNTKLFHKNSTRMIDSPIKKPADKYTGDKG